MRNLSSAFKAELAADNRAYLEYANFTLADGTTTVNITNADIWSGGFTIEDSVSSGEEFQIGSAVINKATLVLNNIYGDFDDYDFFNATAILKIGLELPGEDEDDPTDNIIEEIALGKYTVVNQPEYNGSLITIEMYDNMVEFDRPYTLSNLVYPATLDTIVRDACTVASTLSGKSIILQTTNFPNKSFTVNARPDDENLTFREVLAYAAQIAGCYARMDANGYLTLKWYDQDALEEAITDDDVSGVHYFTGFYNQRFSIDDVVITGVRVSMDVEREETVGSGSSAHTETVYDKEEYLYGSEGYVIAIENNPLIDELQVQTVATYLGGRINGFSFRTADISHSSDPSIEAGDVAVCIDAKGNRYGILVSETVFSVGSAQRTQSEAEDPVRNSAARYSVETKNYVEARKRIAEEKTARELAVEDLNDRIDNAQGLFETQVQQTGGGVITYLHDKPLLAESDIQIKVSTVGVTVTANGTATTPTWYGLTVDGQLISNILNTVGINADWINTGQFVITKNGSTVFFADVDTGDVRIAGDSVVIASGDALDVAISTASGYTLETPVTWSNNNNMATFNAIVYRGVENITSEFDDSWFVWTLRTEAGESQVGTGKTLSLTRSQFGYGATITCTFTTYDNVANLRSVDGQRLRSVDDLQLREYTNLPDTDVLVSDLPIKTAAQVDPYDYLMGIDNVEGYQVSITNFFDYLVTTHTSTIGGTSTTVKSAIESRVSKSGDTMTGNLRLQKATGYAELSFETLDGGSVSWIRAYPDSSQTAYGNVMVINPQGNLILGGGESAQAIYNNDINSAQGTGENAHIAADGTLYFYSGCNTIANRKTFYYSTSGNLINKDGSYYADDETAVVGVTPSSQISGRGYWIRDSAGTNVGWFRSRYYTNGNTGVYLETGRTVSGTTYYNSIRLSLDASGNAVVAVAGTGAAASWRSAIGAVNIAGDTMTGKLTLNSGLSIKSGAGSTNPPYFLCLLNSYSNGGDVGYVASANMAVAIGLSASRIYKNIGTTSVATATDTTIGNTGSLSAGVYVVMYRAAFATNTTGRRVVFLASSTTGSVYETNRMTEAPASGAATELVGCTILELSSATTIYLRVYQNSGGALDVTGQLKVIKIHD